MEILRHFPGPQYCHRVWQQRVDAAHPGRLRAPRAGIEVDHLAAGMDAAVGPARGGDRDRLAGDPGERRFERILNAAAAGLGLPA
jgi:hypothetical protein